MTPKERSRQGVTNDPQKEKQTEGMNNEQYKSRSSCSNQILQQ